MDDIQFLYKIRNDLRLLLNINSLNINSLNINSLNINNVSYEDITISYVIVPPITITNKRSNFKIYFDKNYIYSSYPCLQIEKHITSNNIIVKPYKLNHQHYYNNQEFIEIQSVSELIEIINNIIIAKNKSINEIVINNEIIINNEIVINDEIVINKNSLNINNDESDFIELKSINPDIKIIINKTNTDLLLPFTLTIEDNKTNKLIPINTNNTNSNNTNSNNTNSNNTNSNNTVNFMDINTIIETIIPSIINIIKTYKSFIVPHKPIPIPNKPIHIPNKPIHIPNKPIHIPNKPKPNIIKKTKYRIVVPYETIIKNINIKEILVQLGYKKILYAHNSYCFTLDVPKKPEEVIKEFLQVGLQISL